MTFRVRWLGRVAYRDAHALQQALMERSADDHLLLLEHPHVYTLGVRADLEHVLVPPASVGADEISGGTFTITNPGGYGTFITAPVINQPQVAILSTDGVKKKPVVVELPDGSDSIAIHPVGILALSFDHRAFDGAYASAFVARVKEILETRDWSQEL